MPVLLYALQGDTPRYISSILLRTGLPGTHRLGGAERGAVQLAAVVASIMPLVSEVRHPQSLDFANERKTLLLRDVHGLSWAAIQKQVVNLRGETPSVRLLQRLHQDVNRDLGRRVYKYSNCGRKATKATAAVQKYLVGRLLVLRMRTTCTAATLRRELVANKGVDLDESTIRKILPRSWVQVASPCAEAEVQCSKEEGTTEVCKSSAAPDKGKATREALHGHGWCHSFLAAARCNGAGELLCPRRHTHVETSW